MQAITVPNSTSNTIDSLQIATMAEPTPAPNEIVVRVHAVGLNPIDYKLAQNHNSAWTYPHILGLDIAGEVVALGSAVHNITVGQRVHYHGDLRQNGGFSELAVTTTECVSPIPDGVNYAEAAAILCGSMTAYAALFRKAVLTNRHTVLIHAGAGSVGSTAIQLAHHVGLKVLTTVSTGKVAFVQQLHPEVVIDYHHQDVTKAVMEATNGLGVDLIINAVGTPTANADFDRLAYNGALVCIDGLPSPALINLATRGLSVMSVNLGGAHGSNNSQQQRDLATMARALANLVATKQLDPLIERQLPFAEIPQGLQMLANHEVIGKLVAVL